MALRLITATERLQQQIEKNTVIVIGGYKIGKTSLIRDFDPDTTLMGDFEAGDKSIQDWIARGGHKTETIRTWDDACDFACLIGGIDPAISDATPAGPQRFGPQHYTYVQAEYGKMFPLNKIETIFTDSISKLSFVCWDWAQTQPESWTVATDRRPSVFDPRGCYGLVGRSMSKLLGHLHYSSARNIIYVGGLELHTDEFKRETWQMEMAGQVTARVAPYIADTVISYDMFDYASLEGRAIWTHNPQAGVHRAFVCQKQNPFKLPAGDRSGQLDMIEEPNLRKLIDKMNAPARAAVFDRALPNQKEAAE